MTERPPVGCVCGPIMFFARQVKAQIYPLGLISEGTGHDGHIARWSLQTQCLCVCACVNK